MESQTLTITAPQLLSVFFHRGWSHSDKTFHFILGLLCTYFCLAMCGSSSIYGMQKAAVYDVCRSYEDNQGGGFHDIISGDSNAGYITRNSMTDLNVESVCTSSYLFCFPSTLPGFLHKEHKLNRDALEVSGMESDGPLSIESMLASRWASNKTWSSDYGMFELLNGRTISCSINSKESIHKLSSIQTDRGNQNDLSSCSGTLLSQKSANIRLNKNSEMNRSGCLDVSSSPNVDIIPPVLDWGQKYLFFPSVAFLTVANSCNESILHIYEPFSTNRQFYPCNFSDVFLGPGEVASVCFVFLPRWLGLSTSRLILQTNSGGFLVSAKGFAVESPYKIQPLMNLDIPPSGRLSKNFSLFNPFDETLHVEEVTAWISVLGNTTHHTEAVCSVEKFENSNEFRLLSVNEWLVVKNGRVGFPLTAMRPYRNWEISPQSSETIMEIDFSFGLKGKFFGAFCIQLLRSSHNKSDTVMIPLEIDLDRKAAYDDLKGPVSVSLESLVSCDSGGTFVAISLRNGAPSMLKFVKITEVADAKLFQIKYLEGLLLFPATVTQVAVVTCRQFPIESHDTHPEVSNINNNCKLLILTNDSISSQIEIPCQDIIHVCLRHQKDSSIGCKHESEHVKYSNTRKESVGDDMQSPSEIKALETAEADELVLGNWKSQGATIGMSVLDDHEILFPMVQVGTHHSKWVTVRNPSQQPVVMQLILNSGEIIDECRGTDGFVQPPSSDSMVHSKSGRPTRYGFSIAETALTEVYVHPFGRASFGPIFFHPSNRCSWRSSALIRNNLSGVEWSSLRGFGGSLSLVLLEGSEPIETVEFNLNLSVPYNITPPDMLFHMEETTICSQSLSKELYAKNTGDLPLEVKSIEVSGTECRLDGFVVHTCTGFSLEPGESKKLLISYQTDFSAAMVHRDLELALAAGILVIPMKASLPVCMLNLCKKSAFWMRLKKFSLAVLLVAFLIFLAFCFLYLQMTALGSQDFFFKSEKSSNTAVTSAGKSSRVQLNQRNSKFSMPAEMGCLLGSVGEDKTSMKTSIGKYPDSQNGVPEQEMTAQDERSTLETYKHTMKGALSSLPSKSVVVENSDIAEASQTGNLTVQTGKEKGKRRRKRKGPGAVLTGLLEVSSSQSGNSTPSSPLSPVISVVPNRAWSLSSEIDQPNESRYPFTQQMTDQHCEKGQVPEPPSKEKVSESQPPVKCHGNNWYLSIPEKPSAPRKTFSKSVLLPSATFPSAGRNAPSMLCSSPSLASTSKIAPHARAPGSKLYHQKTDNGDQAGVRDEYTYDIWGDHFSGLRMIGKTKDVTSFNLSATENNSDSFFVRGPKTLVTNSQSRSCKSRKRNLPEVCNPFAQSQRHFEN